MELLNTHSNKVWVNSVDFDVNRLLKGLGQGDYEPYSIQDVDYLPDFKFRRVIKRPYLSNDLIDITLQAAKTANIMNPDAKRYKSLNKAEKACIALDKMHKRFGDDAMVNENGLVIYKKLEGTDYGLRHSICFMPSLKERNIDLYWFMCAFIKTCQQVGIADYESQYYEYYLESLDERYSIDDDHYASSKMEMYSYKYGYPRITMKDINSAPILKSNLKNYGLPLEIFAEIKTMVKLVKTGISIRLYEIDDEEGSYRSLCECNVFCWDDGNIEADVREEVNDYVNNYGLLELADMAIYNVKHFPFHGKGQELKQFLNLFTNNNIFSYLNGKYTPITAESDGTKIYHRDILGQQQLQFGPVCGDLSS